MNNLATLNNLDNDIQKNIYFRIGKSKYALPLVNVLEVMKLPKLDYPQKLPSNFIGVLRFNNMFVNVLDIRFYLDIDVEPYSISSKLIMVRTDETIFGIVVDEIFDIIDFENSRIERMPFFAETQIIEAVYNIDNQNISIINANSLENIIKKGYPDKGVDVSKLFPNDENSVQIFEKRAFSLSERLDLTVTKNVFSDNKFLSFMLNNAVYCIHLKYIKEIANTVNMIKLPCSSPYIEGLMTIKGDFVTILNLKKFLDFNNTDYSTKSKIIVIDSNEMKLGLMIDEINDILDFHEEQLTSKTSHNEDAYVEFEVIDDNNVKYILNLEKILSDEKIYVEEY